MFANAFRLPPDLPRGAVRQRRVKVTTVIVRPCCSTSVVVVLDLQARPAALLFQTFVLASLDIIR
jgi:hypothetical protein